MTILNRMLAAALFGAAFMVVAHPAQADGAGVNIIYPPSYVAGTAKFDAPDEPAHPAGEAHTAKINVLVEVSPFRFTDRHRPFVRDRALFQNYTGFKKVYSGRRYPF